MIAKDTVCRHCQTHLATRSRNLCTHCYFNPDIRLLYPVTYEGSSYRGIRDKCGNPPLPAQPTTSQPGTLEKIAVFMDRAERGECIFHPQDIVVGTGDSDNDLDIPLHCLKYGHAPGNGVEGGEGEHRVNGGMAPRDSFV